jgi:polysaccharide export outer membrane protein
MTRPLLFSLPLLLGLVGLAGCANTGPYVWVTEIPPDQGPGEYTIAQGDVVSIHVVGQEGMTTKAKVRTDGRIAMPLLGDIEMRGKHTSQLRAELEAQLAKYLQAPSVTVNVEEFEPTRVTVLGEVGRAGSVLMEPGGGVAQALSQSGGLTDFADRDRIFVIRKGPQIQRIRFTWEDVTRGERASSSFVLRNGDMIVVE